jgi:PKD repeat protein
LQGFSLRRTNEYLVNDVLYCGTYQPVNKSTPRMRKLLLLFSFTLLAAIDAGAQCAAAFTFAQVPTGNQLLNVQFTNTTYYGTFLTGQIATATINYGDGNSATGVAIPDHNYPSPGTYTVGLRITRQDSATGTVVCTDSTTQMVTVSYPACGSTIGVTGALGSRTFTATTPAGTTGMTYSWNYGDGSPAGNGSPVSHSYATSGIYTITLTATAGSPTNCTYTNSISIYISVPPPPLVCATLNTSFTFGVSGNVATFNNTSTLKPPPYISAATWNYGDGNTGAGFNTPPHTYLAPGIYTVKLVMHWHDSLSITNCKDSTTRQVTVTTIPTTNVISGTVNYSGPGISASYFKIWLIKYDTATNMLYAVDSQVTANTLNAYYAFGGKPAGSYRVKAAMYSTAAVSTTSIVPTYHDSSVYWGTASVINHTGAASINKNINMRVGGIGTGPGFIGGNVSLGANKGAANGVPNQLVFLRNSITNVVRIAYTDVNGDYLFSNIPIGPYSIYPEEMNYTTIPVTPIVLTNTLPYTYVINFNKDDVKHSIAPRSLGTQPLSLAVPQLSVSPNPASGAINISWGSLNARGADIIITNITGKKIMQTPVTSPSASGQIIDIANLAPGVYFVQGTAGLSGTPIKVVIQ